MRGGLVALGAFLVVLGFSWWVLLTLDNGMFLYRVAGVNFAAATWLVCMVPLIFLAVGGMVFLAGLVGKSQAELAAMRAPMYGPPPQVVFYPQPPSPQPPPPSPQAGILRKPPPPNP